MTRRASRMIGRAAAGAIAVIVLTGCAAHENAADAAARDAVADLIGEISHRQAPDIDGWARLAAQATGDRSAITLIGITPQTAQNPIDPLGTLSFRVEMTARRTGMWSAETVSSTSCYAVDFTRYGPVENDRPWSDPRTVLAIAILARLTAPTGPYEQLAPLEVVRTADGAIGASNGVTERVYAPRVYLQPGELGCRGTTARSDLRPPH